MTRGSAARGGDGHPEAGRRRAVIVEAAVGAAFATFGAAVALVADTTPTIPGQAYGPGFFPWLIGCAIVALGALMVVRALRGTIPIDPVPRVEPGSRPFLAALAWTVAGLVAIVLLFEAAGFVVLASVYLAGFMLLLGVRPWLAVSLAVVATLVVDIVFVRLLLVPLPPGLLAGLIR